MTPQEQERNLSQNIIDSLCHISERPDGWLPHIVFVEEEGEDGYPCYVRYNLLDYHADGTCTLQRPNTDVQETDRELREINVDWLITIWNWYKELCAEQNLSSKEYSRPPFRGGDFVRLTDDAIAEIRRIFGDIPADYRRNMLLQVKYMRQNSANSSWHIGVQDIHEDDVLEFDSNFLRSATVDDISSLSNKERFYAFVWSCNHLNRSVSDAELLDAWRNGPSRSAIDEEDETEYEVERLTLDELAERSNDECFNDTEDYVRFIQITD